MLSKYCIFLIVIFCSCKNVQKNDTDKAEIQKVIDAYNKAYLDQDWKYVASLVHPEVFNFFSKEDFIKMLDDTIQRKYYKIISKELFIDSITPSLRDRENKYVLLYLHTKSTLELSSEIDSLKTEEVTTNMCKTLKENFGADFTNCVTSNRKVSYQMKEKCYATFLSEQKKWFILIQDENTKKIVDKIIPREIVRKLK